MLFSRMAIVADGFSAPDGAHESRGCAALDPLAGPGGPGAVGRRQFLLHGVSRSCCPVSLGKALTARAVALARAIAVEMARHRPAALYLWAYEAFSLWDSPAWTAWIIARLFRGRLRHRRPLPWGSVLQICLPDRPVQFRQFAGFSVRSEGPRPEPCQSAGPTIAFAATTAQRGCELYLFQPRKVSNLDCTFCLDCVHACPHDNIGIFAVAPAATLVADPYRSSLGRLSNRLDLAALALLLVFGAFATRPV